MSDTAYKISVMQAFEEGETIEFTANRKEWLIVRCENPSWSWGDVDYRVKKEPMVIYCNVYTDGHINTIHKTIKSAETAFREIQKLRDNQDIGRCAVKFQEVIEE